MIELTQRQIDLWRLSVRGLSLSEIASALKISRQAVHKGLQSLETKIYKALIGVAKANRIEIREINAKKGYLVGWSPEFGVEVIITFSAKNGVQVWFRHKGDCKNCSMREECRRILLNEAEERGIELKEDEPCKMAEELFRRILVR
jgi:predicted transcriptional regulator